MRIASRIPGNTSIAAPIGGAGREGVLVYCHANGKTIDEVLEAAASYRAMGYKAIRLQSGIPGLASTYGVSKDKLFYEPADADIPTEKVWSTEKYSLFVPQLFEKAREKLGWDVHLLHDVHHRLTPIEAGRLGCDLEDYRLFWLEDAVPAANQEGFRLIRQHTTTPLAVGEIFNTVWDCKQLIEEQLIDYIRTTVVHAGGITHLRRIATLAEIYKVRTGSHGATDLSPVCMGAELRHPGIHAPHARDRRRVPARLPVQGRVPLCRREAGPRRRHRRDAGGE